MTPSSIVPNTIEREIRIAAPVERVWTLVSEPGWWINEGEVRPHLVEQRDGLSIVHDEKHGAFAIETVEVVEPEHIVFSWRPGGVPDTMEDGIPTLVTFTLTPDGDEVVVKVVESGFAEGDVPDEERREAYEGNVQGWAIEMAAAKAHVEAQ